MIEKAGGVKGRFFEKAPCNTPCYLELMDP